MHILGLWGMPRRVYTYPVDMGWGGLNLLSTLGAYVLALGVLIYVGNLAFSLNRGRIAGPNPWGGGGLEWATNSPPPSYNFGLTPVVEGREPLWLADGELPVAGGLSLEVREVLLTSVADAEPDVRHGSPGPSIWPFVTAIAVSALFVGSVFDEWWIVWLTIPCALCVLGWFWPRPSHGKLVGAPKDDVPPGALA
jgi:cytochrome c oxidase subunit 1